MMPQTGMDGWVIAGVLIAALGIFIVWRRSGKKTENVIRHGSGNMQTGGDGDVRNTVDHGDNNNQSG